MVDHGPRRDVRLPVRWRGVHQGGAQGTGRGPRRCGKPAGPHVLGDGVQFYGFPAEDDGRVKVAFFRSRVTGEPAIREALAAALPSLAQGTLVETVTCKYTLTPDHHFVIGLHPDWPTVTIASPCSGHGYKFASVIGEILADLAIDGATRHPIGLFDPRRFRDSPS